MLLSFHLKNCVEDIEILGNNSEIIIRISSKLIIHMGKSIASSQIPIKLMKINNLQMQF